MRKSDEERGRPGIFRHVHDVRWMWGGGGGGGGGGGQPQISLNTGRASSSQLTSNSLLSAASQDSRCSTEIRLHPPRVHLTSLT